MSEFFDIIVIGAGASGLMVSYYAALKGYNVLLVEKMEKCGRKVRISGKGRCNITNVRTPEEIIQKVRSGTEFVSGALKSYTSEDVIAFFKANGVDVDIERGGRVFPKSGKAWDVATALENAARKAGVEIRCNAKVNYIDVDEKTVSVSGVEYFTNGKKYRVGCKKVVVATGGCSYPLTGSDGDGYKFAYELGHNIEPLRPALVPLEIGCKHLRIMSGTLLKNINLRLEVDRNAIREEFGEAEFTDFGIMGAIVLKVSRDAVDALIERKRVELVIDLKPSLSVAKLKGQIERELETDGMLTVDGLLRKMLPKSMIGVVRDNSGIRGDVYLKSMTEETALKIINSLKELRFTVTAHRGFSEAIVTAGGVSLDEVDDETYESKIINGLYFTGEVLDIDADTGGYNLQLAFSTAYKMADSLKKV